MIRSARRSGHEARAMLNAASATAITSVPAMYHPRRERMRRAAASAELRASAAADGEGPVLSSDVDMLPPNRERCLRTMLLLASKACT